MPAAKSLIRHVKDRTFSASRHGDLLLRDRSLLPFQKRQGDDPFWVRLLDFQIAYRQSRSRYERRELALGFAEAVNYGDWERWHDRFDGLMYSPNDETGGFELVPCECDYCTGVAMPEASEEQLDSSPRASCSLVTRPSRQNAMRSPSGATKRSPAVLDHDL